MKLHSDLAMKILAEVKTLTQENVILINKEGIIIASIDESRIGTFHEGSQIVMQSKKSLYITKEKAKQFKGVKPGINLPIFFQKDVIGVVGITGNREKVTPFAEMIRRMTELLIREAHYYERKEWEMRGLESFIYEWIYTAEPDDILIEKSEIIGIPLHLPYQCILIEIDSSLAVEEMIDVQREIIDWFQREYFLEKNDFLLRWGTNRLLLLKGDPSKTDKKRLNNHLKSTRKHFLKQNIPLAIGVGNIGKKYHLTQSYNEANKALDVAKRNFTIVFYRSLLLDLILEEIDEETKSVYLKRILTPIQDNQRYVLTLETYYLNNLSMKQTAEDLHIHINTLHYRLAQIKKLTNIDPKEPKGITLFMIALELLQ